MVYIIHSYIGNTEITKYLIHVKNKQAKRHSCQQVIFDLIAKSTPKTTQTV